jgi:uncharacterized membrane protein
MGVKLLPAIIFVILLFLAGLLFLQGRTMSGRSGDISAGSSGRMAKPVPFIALMALVSLLGLLFILLGKIALLISVVIVALFFLSRKKT